MSHKKLVEAAYKWLLSIGCAFAFRELVTSAMETPDVIGWKNGYSILVECKASRSNFIADKKKDFRKHERLGVGFYRFYLCPESVIQRDHLPDKWGLLWLVDGKIKRIHAPKGNIWSEWPSFERNFANENLMLCSALRRVHANAELEKIFF